MRARLWQDGCYDFAFVGETTEFAEIDSLPGANVETTVGDGDGDGRADDARLCVRNRVVGPFVGVFPRQGFGDHIVQSLYRSRRARQGQWI